MEIELHQKISEINQKAIEANHSRQRILVDKVAELRCVLAEHWIGGKTDDIKYVPLLDGEDAKKVKDKLMSLIEKF